MLFYSSEFYNIYKTKKNKICIFAALPESTIHSLFSVIVSCKQRYSLLLFSNEKPREEEERHKEHCYLD